MVKRGLMLFAGLYASVACFYLGAAFLRQRFPSGFAGGSTSTDATIGDTNYMGASNCDKAIKTQLTDPDSYQRIATQIVDAKPGSGWVARTSFRSRNGFGGFMEATADCVFDGNSYRAIVMQ